MKIGITCYPTYGGSGVVATELGKALADRGHEVHFISYGIPMRLTQLKENIFYHEVEISNYPLFEFPLYDLALTSKMVEVCKYDKIDILHVHYAIPHSISAMLAQQIVNENGNTLKFTTTLHGTDITLVGLEPSFLPLVKHSIERSDGVTAVSNFLKDKTLTNYKIKKEIDVIPNFVDTSIYKKIENCAFKSHFAPNGEKVLVHISNFRPVKRVPDVISIFEKVREKIHSKLILAGDGPDRSECERIVREKNLKQDVHFLGKQEAVVDILNASDLFIMPSQSESFGLSALESMACGLPTISSSVGGLPELVVHAETGFIAEIGDIDRMAKYAIDLLTNENKYKLFSENARMRAEKCFNKDKIVKQYEAHYKKVLS
ncbi:MAG: N-acetyl-alpha-D-glucosaminyl L-malate synthase BshA [Ignavibacteria bacterium]|nr:N-acetyl-alpha-D-glucosaminyl L-malate synthase BshA [Ignavibacteria bacterium]